jgi:hypothetical protein
LVLSENLLMRDGGRQENEDQGYWELS